MPFVNFNADLYLPCGSRLENEVNTFPSVSPPCLFSLIAFLNLVYWQGTISSSLTVKERAIHARFPVFVLGVHFC